MEATTSFAPQHLVEALLVLAGPGQVKGRILLAAELPRKLRHGHQSVVPKSIQIGGRRAAPRFPGAKESKTERFGTRPDPRVAFLQRALRHAGPDRHTGPGRRSCHAGLMGGVV